jgi:hypothetical protein
MIEIAVVAGDQSSGTPRLNAEGNTCAALEPWICDASPINLASEADRRGVSLRRPGGRYGSAAALN